MCVLNREVMPWVTLEEKLDFDFLDNVVGITTRCLMKYGGLDEANGVTDEYYQVALDQWAMLDTGPICAQLESFQWNDSPESDRLIWTHVLHLSQGDEKLKPWSMVSRLALRFISAGVSEAEVERLLSKQSYIQGQNTTCISMEALTARLQLFGKRSIDSVMDP